MTEPINLEMVRMMRIMKSLGEAENRHQAASRDVLFRHFGLERHDKSGCAWRLAQSYREDLYTEAEGHWKRWLELGRVLSGDPRFHDKVFDDDDWTLYHEAMAASGLTRREDSEALSYVLDTISDRNGIQRVRFLLTLIETSRMRKP